jgi:hypothetical protein
LLAVLTLLSLAGFLPGNRARTVALLNDQVPEAYNHLILRELGGFSVEYNFNKTMTHLIDPRIAYIHMEDARIVPRLEAGLAGRFSPHYLSTVVFAVPDGLDEIRFFSDLRDASCRLFVSRKHVVRILPAMALALSGADSLDEAVALLVRLKAEGRLIVGQTPGEFESVLDGNTVALMPDDEAAAADPVRCAAENVCSVRRDLQLRRGDFRAVGPGGGNYPRRRRTHRSRRSDAGRARPSRTVPRCVRI